MANVLVSLEDLDYYRNTLAAVYAYFHAKAMVDSQDNMRADVKDSPLGIEVKACLEEIETVIKQKLLDMRDQKPEPEEIYEPEPQQDFDVYPNEEDDGHDHEWDEDGFCLLCGAEEADLIEDEGDEGE